MLCRIEKYSWQSNRHAFKYNISRVIVYCIVCNAPGIQCSGPCKKLFHKKCAAIPDDIFNTLKDGFVSWTCNICKAKRQSLVIADTNPNPGFGTPGSSPSTSLLNLTNLASGYNNNYIASGMNKSYHTSGGVINNSNYDVDSINTTLSAVQAAQNSVQTALSNLTLAVNSFNQKVLDIESRLTVVEGLKSENSELKKRIKALELTVTDLEKHKFSKSLEIKGIPFVDKEDIVKTIGVVAENISCEVRSSDLDNIFRVGKTDAIVVTFTSKLKQREFLQAAKKKKPNLAPLCSSLGIAEKDQHGNIYINESVSKKARFLLKIGRDLKREKKIHWIGTESGNVVVRKSYEGKKYIIKELADFEKLSNLETKTDSESEED
jgi:Baculovirus FP protein